MISDLKWSRSRPWQQQPFLLSFFSFLSFTCLLDWILFPFLKCLIGLQSVTDALLNEEEACFKIICSFRLTPHRKQKAHYQESKIASPLIIKKRKKKIDGHGFLEFYIGPGGVGLDILGDSPIKVPIRFSLFQSRKSRFFLVFKTQ